MSTFEVELRDLRTGKVNGNEKIPHLHEIISKLTYHHESPYVIVCESQPLMPYLQQVRIGKVPIYPTPEQIDCAERIARSGLEGSACVRAVVEALGYTIDTHHGERPLDETEVNK